MGKSARPRTLSESQARAVGRNIRVSPRKLNLVAQSIRGKSAESALSTLTFTSKRIARDVKKILQSAIANAENNHDLDVDDLIVSEASVGKNLTMKRFHARARGRSGRIEKPFSQITIVVEEKRMLETTKKQAAAKAAKSTSSKAAPARKKSEKPAAKDVAEEKAAKAPAAKKPAAKKAPAKAAAKGETKSQSTKSKSTKSKSTKSPGATKKSGKAKEA
nr:MAG: 50S ribosomal protein L22 [Hyphomicrobiales bacterium]